MTLNLDAITLNQILNTQLTSLAAENLSLKQQLSSVPVISQPDAPGSPVTAASVTDGTFTTLGLPAPWKGIFLPGSTWQGNYFIQQPNSAANNGNPPVGNTLELQMVQWPTNNGQPQFA
jgi:hypothetical protein